MLKLLVSYVQNLQNTKFYSHKIKFGLQCVSFKKFQDVMSRASTKANHLNNTIIYNISVKPKLM